MPFVKGQRKLGGRKAGTLNKKTVELKANIESRIGKLEDAMVDLYVETDEPMLKFAILKELFQYVYPKRKSIEIVEESDETKGDQAKDLLEMPDHELLEAMKERLRLIANNG